MLLQILLGVLVTGLVYVYTKWSRVRSYWRDRGVPCDAPHPLLGSLTFLQKKNPFDWMRNVYERFDAADYVGIWLFWRPGLIVNSPELARRVLVKDFDAFRDRFLSSGKSDPIGQLNIFTVNDPTWSSLRRRLTSIFTASKLRSMFPLKQLKAKELVQRIHMENEKKAKVDLRDIYTNYTTDIIGTSAFGVAGDATLTGKSPMREVTKDFAKYSVMRGLAWASIFFLPWAVDIFRFKMFPKSTTDYFRKVFLAMVAQRGGWQREVVNSQDLLDALVKIKSEAAKDGEDMSEDIILSQAVIFVQGGFDTSGVSLTMTTYELAHSPDVQEKLYAEIKAARDKLGHDDFDATTLTEMVYLNCVIKESLRKYPAMGWIDRIATKDYAVDDKVTITKGTPVYVNAVGMHYDPKYYPEPKKFYPERFLGDNETNSSFTYLPFGEGPRNCIGKRFAMHTLQCAIAAMVLNFELRPYPGTYKPEEKEIAIDPIGLFLAPKNTLSVIFEPRN